MTENADGTDGPQPERRPESAPTSGAAPQPILKTRWRDRAWTLRAMIAVAAATFIVGGLLGGFVGAAVSHDDHPGDHRMRPWVPGHGPGGFQRGGRGWRWYQGPARPPGVAPYGGPNAPSQTPAPTPVPTPAPTPSSGSNG